MYENLKGKKLLVVGSDPLTANIVKVAKELGVYVIAVDGLETSANTPAKLLADEAWTINYANTQEIGERCLAEKVDGVLGSYSEFRVMAACKIANYIGTPFYATQEQINLTRNKRLFKDACLQYGVPIPGDYFISDDADEKSYENIPLPVIVKPADYAGRKGITICFTREELLAAVPYARKFSETNTVIIEEYLVGDEISATYTLKDGQISLSTMLDKYINDSQERVTGLCDLAISPSRWHKMYVETIDEHIKAFLTGIGAKDGVAYFQGIANEKGIKIFEMGYRVNGNSDYQYIERNNGISYMKMLIAHSLTGQMEGDLSKDNPLFDCYYCSYLLYAHAGEIKTYDYSEIENYDGVYHITPEAFAGKTIAEDGSTQQKIITVKFMASDREQIKEKMAYIREHVKVLNENNEDMLFKPFDYNRIS